MSNDWILKTKLTEPTPPANSLERVVLPLDVALPPVVLLVAGAGYGKTLALAGLARRAGAEGALIAWYSLDPYDADPATFFHYLAAAVRHHIPPFGAGVEAMLGAEPDPRQLWHHFFRDLMAFNIPGLVLVFDDCHALLDGALHLLEALVSHLDRLPPGVRILLSSRRRLPFRWARLRAAGTVVELGPQHLRFAPDEQAAFLRARAPAGNVPEAWTRRAEALDGWPLGLTLLTRCGTNPMSGGCGPDADLIAFLREELYTSQPPALQAFLLQLALLQEPTIAACEAIFAVPDARAFMQALEAEMLVFGLADGESYRLPTFLGDFLVAEGRQTLTAPTLASWHAAAARYYLARALPEIALSHLVASADWSGLASACQASFPAMVASARRTQIERWLAAVPKDVAATEPTLLLWQGIASAHRGQHAAARGHYERARRLYADASDLAGELKAVVRLCGLALIGHDRRRTNQLLLQAQALLAAGCPEDMADLHLMRAMAAERRGDMALMRECNEAVLAIAVGRNVEVAACHGVARLNLFTWWHHAGDLEAAKRLIDEAVELAEHWRFYGHGLFGRFLQASLALTTGEVEAAGAILRSLPADWADLFDWHDRACALTIMGHHLTATGAWREADEALRKARATFHEVGSLEGEKVVLERQLWLAIHRRQPTRARELFEDAGAPTGDSIFELAIAVPQARGLHLAGDGPAARTAWQQIIPALEGLGAHLHLARAHLYQAATFLAVGDRESAGAAWDQATVAIDTRGYSFLRSQDQVLWEELRPLSEKAIGKIAESRAETPRVATAASEPGPAGLPHLPGKLVINLFGTFEVFQGGVRLDNWPRRKSRLLLAALALYPRGLPLSELAELLGDSLESPNCVVSLRTSVMALRKALEPDLDKRANSRYILHETDRYVLDMAMVEAIDVRLFEEALAAGERAGANAAEAIGCFQKAVATYRGGLLEDGALGGTFDGERERYRRHALAALNWLADDAHRRMDQAAEEKTLTRAAAIGPCEEDIVLRLIRHHLLGGRPERMRQAYWDHRKAVKATLGIEPSAAFETAYRQLAFPAKIMRGV